MESPFKTPEQLLQYRSLEQILADKGTGVYSIAAGEPVFSALELMAEKNVGFLIVDERGKMVGVLSERDYARRVILQARSSKDTPPFAGSSKFTSCAPKKYRPSFASRPCPAR